LVLTQKGGMATGSFMGSKVLKFEFELGIHAIFVSVIDNALNVFGKAGKQDKFGLREHTKCSKALGKVGKLYKSLLPQFKEINELGNAGRLVNVFLKQINVCKLLGNGPNSRSGLLAQYSVTKLFGKVGKTFNLLV
jgi:hypothetical protein